MVRRFLWIAATVLLSSPAAAVDPPYLGAWIVAEGHPAPWVDLRQPATAPYDDHIIGKTVTFTPSRIIAPPPLSCRAPAYAIHQVPPESLFEGGLPHAEAEAARLGFATGEVPTLATNCNAMLEYHFTAAGTALFALNNTIYVLRRR